MQSLRRRLSAIAESESWSNKRMNYECKRLIIDEKTIRTRRNWYSTRLRAQAEISADSFPIKSAERWTQCAINF